MKMSAQGHPLVFNERRGNPNSIGQAAASPKTLLYTGTMDELPPYTQVTQGETIQEIQRQKNPDLGLAKKMPKEL